MGPYFITGGITAVRYVAEILTPMLRDIRKLFGDESFILQQDGAGAHRAASTQKWLHEHDVDFVEADDYPGNSPDLNIVEGVWNELKAEQFPAGCFGVATRERERLATQFFRRFSVQRCRQYLDSTEKRMDLLHDVGYWSIPY